MSHLLARSNGIANGNLRNYYGLPGDALFATSFKRASERRLPRLLLDNPFDLVNNGIDKPL
jgi:hypothetical protein